MRKHHRRLIEIGLSILALAALVGVFSEGKLAGWDKGSTVLLSQPEPKPEQDEAPKTEDAWIEKVRQHAEARRLVHGLQEKVKAKAGHGDAPLDEHALKALFTEDFDGQEMRKDVDANTVMPPNILWAWWTLYRYEDFEKVVEALSNVEAKDDVAEDVANEHLGRMAWALHRRDTARSFFDKVDGPESCRVKTARTEIEADEGNWSAAARFSDDDCVRKSLSPDIQRDISVHQNDIPSTLRLVIQGIHTTLPAIVASLLLGLCWFIFLLYIAGLGQWTASKKLLLPIAWALGYASIVPTLVLVTFQDSFFIDREAAMETLPKLFIYFVASVGVREELCKLFVFMPLVFLIPKGKDAQALILASLVGLGFAVGENSIYLQSGAGGIGVSRFLTANFFHIALTGLIGLSWFRAMRYGGATWNVFVTTLLSLIVAHGAYDFLLVSGILDGYLAMTVFVLLSMRYFEQMRSLLKRRVHTLRVFTVVLSSAVGIEFIYICLRADIRSALHALVGVFLGSAVIAYMFFREFDDE